MTRVQRIFLLVALCAIACPVRDGRGAGAPARPQKSQLELVRSIPLAVPEPSDLCLDRDGEHWWTVSDRTGYVYRLRLSDGAVVATLRYRGEDPEGIWQDPQDGSLYVTEERTRQVVHMDSTGRVLGRVTIAGLGGKANSGLEGITFSPATGHFYLLQEKRPARLVEANAAGKVLALTPVDSLLDLSGVTWVPSRNQLLVISDQSRKVCWMSLAGEPIALWDTGVENGEGVAVDTTLKRMYVVSDSQGKFYEFRMP